jgi:hypothetical protein
MWQHTLMQMEAQPHLTLQYLSALVGKMIIRSKHIILYLAASTSLSYTITYIAQNLMDRHTLLYDWGLYGYLLGYANNAIYMIAFTYGYVKIVDRFTIKKELMKLMVSLTLSLITILSLFIIGTYNFRNYAKLQFKGDIELYCLVLVFGFSVFISSILVKHKALV